MIIFHETPDFNFRAKCLGEALLIQDRESLQTEPPASQQLTQLGVRLDYGKKRRNSFKTFSSPATGAFDAHAKVEAIGIISSRNSLDNLAGRLRVGIRKTCPLGARGNTIDNDSCLCQLILQGPGNGLVPSVGLHWFIALSELSSAVFFQTFVFEVETETPGGGGCGGGRRGGGGAGREREPVIPTAKLSPPEWFSIKMSSVTIVTPICCVT